ncbi:MAG: hypothetical protein HQK87_03855 [Nitrospinae bacterium]|nr:hypothetical protein [Nitrospinota bacterium]
MSARLWAYLFGVELALLQTGAFFHLQVRLTAAYPSYLTVLLTWLAGSIIGLRLARGGASLGPVIRWTGGALVAYYASYLLLRAFPYELTLLPLHGGSTLAAGIAAGVFFATARRLFLSASPLFFWENNGFITGWVVGFVGYTLWAERFTLLAPPVGLALVALAGYAAWRRAHPPFIPAAR